MAHRAGGRGARGAGATGRPPDGGDVPRRSELRSWGIAAIWALATLTIVGVLAEALVLTAYAASDSSLAPGDVARLGGVVFYWFHHVGVEFTLSRLSVPGMAGDGGAAPSFAFTLSLALMLGTFAAVWLLHEGGRSVAKAVGGRQWSRGLHGMKVAVPYAGICLALAWVMEFDVGIEGTSLGAGAVSVRPSYTSAALWPLLIALASGFAGGLRSAGPDLSPSRPWAGLSAGAIAGAWRMLVLGLVLSLLGLLVLAALNSAVTRTYLEGTFDRAPPNALVAIALHVLAVPNLAALVLFPSMGGCVGAFGMGTSLCVLSYTSFPTGVDGLPSLGFVAGGGFQPRLGAAPSAYFAFLLVPAVAALLGGATAARRAAVRSRLEGAGAGVLAGALFAVLALAVAILASVSVKTVVARPGSISSTVFRFGPDPFIGTLAAAAWGIGGGGLGGFLRKPTAAPTALGGGRSLEEQPG